jgi:hypothetical protein
MSTDAGEANPNVDAALDKGIPLTTPSFFADLTLDQAQDIFQPDNVKIMHEMPLLAERVRVMNQAGKVLCDKYHGLEKFFAINTTAPLCSL